MDFQFTERCNSLRESIAYPTHYKLSPLSEGSDEQNSAKILNVSKSGTVYLGSFSCPRMRPRTLRSPPVAAEGDTSQEVPRRQRRRTWRRLLPSQLGIGARNCGGLSNVTVTLCKYLGFDILSLSEPAHARAPPGAPSPVKLRQTYSRDAFRRRTKPQYRKPY